MKASSCCLKSEKSPSPEGVKKEIDNVLSTETVVQYLLLSLLPISQEFTELASSRKTSMALSTFSSGSQVQDTSENAHAAPCHHSPCTTNHATPRNPTCG